MNDAATRRSLRVVQQVEPHRVLVDGRWLLNFASNDYLGLSQHPKVKQAASQALQQWGTGSGSSALLSGYSSCHERLAMELAAWKDTNGQPSSGNECGELRSENVATLLFPTGYAANVGLLTSVIEPEDHVFSDRKNHASIIDGLRLAQAMHRQVTVRHFRHRDYADLERLLRAMPAGGRRWIVTDSVFSMDGTTVPAARVWQLAQQYSCGLIVDEAHATGVCGDTGSGLFKFGDSNQPETSGTGLIVVGTLSKALGAAGGFVCCDPELAQRLLQSARSMIYSTALPPATVAAASQALQLARDDDQWRVALHQHVARLHRELQEMGWQTTGDLDGPLLSVLAGDAQQALSLSHWLLDEGIFAPAIRQPTVKPLECRIRISPIATMGEAELSHLLAAFSKLRGHQPGPVSS